MGRGRGNGAEILTMPRSSSFALVDVNNFYASCEAVFEPRLRGTALCVLSNNDGCVVARSKEAKALGVKMGEPWQLVRARVPGLIHRSSNYELYGDLSARVMRIAAQFAPHVECYSIDECFLELEQLQQVELAGELLELRTRIRAWTGLPVSVGGRGYENARKARERHREGDAGRGFSLGVPAGTRARSPPRANPRVRNLGRGRALGAKTG